MLYCKADALSAVFVEPQFAGPDQYTVTNLIEESNVGGVSVNGVPGPGIDVVTRTGYVGQPIFPFNGTSLGCSKSFLLSECML